MRDTMRSPFQAKQIYNDNMFIGDLVIWRQYNVFRNRW